MCFPLIILTNHPKETTTMPAKIHPPADRAPVETVSTTERADGTLWQKQKAARPKIQNVIGDCLDGDALANALDFLSFLDKNKLSNAWVSTNNWIVSYKNQGVCYIKLKGATETEPCSWIVNPKFGPEKYGEGLMDNERFKEIVWANVGWCTHCGIGRCAGGVPITLCGKEIKPICYHHWISFANPEGETLDCVKKIIETRKRNIADAAPASCDPTSPLACDLANNNRAVCRKCRRNSQALENTKGGNSNAR